MNKERSQKIDRREFLFGLFEPFILFLMSCGKRRSVGLPVSEVREDKLEIPTPLGPSDTSTPEIPNVRLAKPTSTPESNSLTSELLESYPKIDEKVRSYEWVRGYLERNISLIGMLKSKDKVAEMMSRRGSQEGIRHLDSGYSLSAEIMKFTLWMKENLSEITGDSDFFSNCLCYLGLLLEGISLDFHEIGTSASSHGNPGWHYYILDPGLIKDYRAENKEEIEEIAARSEKIFYEVHDWAQNPECIKEDLRNYEDRLEKLANNMRKAGLLTSAQKEAVRDSLHGRIEGVSYFIFGKDKGELEDLLREIRERLGLAGDWNQVDP